MNDTQHTTVESGYSDTLRNLNFSRTVAGITKWFWVTIEGYLSYLLPTFEYLVPTSLGSGAIYTRRKCVTVTADYCKEHFLDIRLTFVS